MRLKLVIDENISHWQETFAQIAEVQRLPGRDMTADQLRDADALIVRSVTPVNQSLLQGTPIKFVGTCTIGVDHLDEAYLTQHSIAYAHAAGCNANAVAEYVITALLENCFDLEELEELKRRPISPNARSHSTGKVKVGIVGFGHVGQALYKKLLPLGVEILINDPPLEQQLHRTPAAASTLPADSQSCFSPLNTLLEQCDIVSLHTPNVTTGPYPTRHLIGAHNLHRLRPGAWLLNAGRGEVVCNQALQQRTDLQLILDVWEAEPLIDLKLLQQTKRATPHIAGYSWLGKVNGTLMIYQALGEAFGLQLPAPNIQPPTQSISIDALLSQQPSLSGLALLRAIAIANYPISEDDYAMRAMLLEPNESSATTRYTPFDQLRKLYKPRLEWQQLQLQGTARLSAEDRALLSTLGFSGVSH